MIINYFPQNDFEEKVIKFIQEWQNNSNFMTVQTSGSTGKPKIIEVEKVKMLNSAKMTCDFLKLNVGNSALLCLPIEFISGKMMVVRFFERKLKLLIKTPSAKPLEDLNEKIDFCAMSPFQVENSLDKIHFINNLIIGGAQVSENLKNKIKEKLSTKNQEPRTKVFETYGMSETLSHIALKEIFPKNEPFFTVFNEIEISLDDRNCLRIFAPKLHSEIIQTNDMVELISPYQFKFLGRADFVINSGGIKIFPEELENLVKKSISNEIVFVGIPDEILGQKLILVIEGEEKELIYNQLSMINYNQKYHKPKEIIFIKEIPRTKNGKIDRINLVNKIKQEKIL